MKIASIKSLASLFVFVALASCGSSTPATTDGGTSTGTFACTTTTVNADPQHTTSCYEYTGFVMSAAQGSCTTGHMGTFATGMCTRTGALGGCRQAAVAGAVTTTWYYAETGQMPTAASVMAHCAAQTPAETYVAP